MRINKNGFTIIQVSIAVMILIVILFIIVAATRGDKGESTDLIRKTNLFSIQTALEKCFSDHRSYDQDIYSSGSCVSTKIVGGKIPVDPVTGSNYIYTSFGYPSTSYTLTAQMDKLKSEENIDANGLMVLKNKQ